MSRKAMRPRTAFSLLEVIIATAILAGSALVLFSLISLGSKYGNRAEERTIAVVQAQSVLDDFIARLANQELSEEVRGVLPSVPVRSFRIQIRPYEWIPQRSDSRSRNSAEQTPSTLLRITVSIYASDITSGANSSESPSLCELSRLVRRTATVDSMAVGGPGGGQ